MESHLTPDGKLLIRVRYCGNVAAFKNAKRMTPKGLITAPKMKSRMNAIRSAIGSELNSILGTVAAGTSMAALRVSLIKSLPHDDCWTVIPELIVTGELCEAGHEGCDIEIEPISPAATSS